MENSNETVNLKSNDEFITVIGPVFRELSALVDSSYPTCSPCHRLQTVLMLIHADYEFFEQRIDTSSSNDPEEDEDEDPDTEEDEEDEEEEDDTGIDISGKKTLKSLLDRVIFVDSQ